MVGASVIAVTPISPPPTASVMSSPAVQLAAIPGPLQLYPQVVERSVANVGVLSERYFADPFPIIRRTLANQAAAFEDAVTALQFGRSDEFFVALARFALQPLTSVVHTIGGVLNVVYMQPELPERLFAAAIGPLLNGVAATGLAIADVLEAITTLDVIGLVNAVINIPARIIDGVLNGVPGTSLENFPGLLRPAFTTPSYRPGLIGLLIRLDQSIGSYITPLPSSAINKWSGPEGQTMMLTTEPEAEPVALQKQWPTEDEAVVEERGPATEELDVPTSDVPGNDVPTSDVPGDEVPEAGVPEQEVPGEEVAEEADDLVEQEPAPSPEQDLPDTELTDDESSSPASTDEANDPGAESNG